MVRVQSALLAAAGICAAAAAPARADDPNGDGIDDDLYAVRHPDTPWWLSGQLNVISQAQPGFHAPYDGPHSLRSGDHWETSYVATVFGAYEVTRYTALELAGESAGGAGLSTALGLAGFTNLDVVRNPTLGATPYVGRALVHAVIPLSADQVVVARQPFPVLRKVAARRIEIRAGKLSTVDVFDANDIGTDSHRQFMNWTIDNNGAYDYAADTRGYSYGATIEYIAPLWALRYGLMAMPTVANGITLDTDYTRARGQQLELELHDCAAGHPGVVRLLGFLNDADMGSYDEAIAEFRQGIVDSPDITATRVQGRTKYGFGINAQQEVSDDVRVFGRFGWADGQNESFAYTEVDNTLELGADLHGTRWGRPHDQIGLAAVTNGLSTPHRTYLALGGQGFLLGDGKLAYGREDIVEAYYTAQVHRGIFPAIDLQVIDNPGYNRDRGPVVVGSLRLHVEL